MKKLTLEERWLQARGPVGRGRWLKRDWVPGIDAHQKKKAAARPDRGANFSQRSTRQERNRGER